MRWQAVIIWILGSTGISCEAANGGPAGARIDATHQEQVDRRILRDDLRLDVPGLEERGECRPEGIVPNAHAAPVETHGRIQHGHDGERPEVAVRELGGARVFERSDRGRHPLGQPLKPALQVATALDAVPRERDQQAIELGLRGRRALP